MEFEWNYNIVYGVNCDKIDPADKIICAASCTTNAIVPVLKVMDEKFGIVSGHIETIHSYTNDQNLIDNYEGELKQEAQLKLDEVNALQPKLQERKDGSEWDIEFEQEGKVRDDIFEVDEEEEYELELDEE